jgi:hypothetical protein
VKYLLLIHQADAPRPQRDGDTNAAAAAAWEALPDEEKQAVWADYMAVNQTPGVTPGLELRPAETAKTVQVKNRQTLVHDGPFVETKEAIAGFLLLEAESLEAAIELAARIPAARLGGAIEVREVVER